MAKISDRVRGLTAGMGDGWGVYHRARALKAQGVAITDLTIGEHDIRTDPAILDAMQASARGGHTGYAALAGTGDLRDAIAARVTERTGMRTTRENVLVTPGGQAALFSALMGVMDPGAEVALPDPYYATYPGTVRAAGGVPVPVPTRPEDGFQPRAEALSAAIGDRSAALMVNSPNNPTGAVYGAETMDGIAEVAQRHDLWLISDEVYDTQLWSGGHLSARALPGMADRTLVVGSMSKSHAMTGSRIGWLVGPPAMIADLVVLATHTTYGVAGFVQDAALHALRLGPEFEARIAAPFRRRRAACLELLGQAARIRAHPSAGAMYLMLDIRATGLSATAFAERLLDERRIAVMPGESFGQAAAGHVRVALTLPDDALLNAFDSMLSFAEEIMA
ncbi:pyridoxal phosphate-dependent aminotransferase [Jannaschia ovalis]|uniref:Aminotransferase n=1 Tax=Jannaschia ovalis TaxID=3038773 RepID=A0ABY8LB81_9RHOB|nr:aminotransferase class I/II-fold pyridoxal phosphate-dependent enzyme [Jannaschia sp. GRR-S6-38]WGH78531.1 aminotransferase class I/II-fold pyridoxal phosphate-dependent enzyme [Jannaschia sp. GRR-S6-38]